MLYLEVTNTFTDVEFLEENILISSETNNNDLKFWDMRKMLTTELDYFFNLELMSRVRRRDIIKKINSKKYFFNLNPMTSTILSYNKRKERLKLSSKFLSTNNYLFPSAKSLPLRKIGVRTKQTKLDVFLNKKVKFEEFNVKKDYKKPLGIRSGKDVWKNKVNDNTLHPNIKPPIIPYTNHAKNPLVPNRPSFPNKTCINYDRTLHEIFDEEKSESEVLEEEKEFRNKIRKIKEKESIKGLTSIHVNRRKGKILVNSVSGRQYLYDSALVDEEEPLEVGLNSSSLFVKSVTSPSGRYILSGSKEPEIVVWDLGKKHKKNDGFFYKEKHLTSIHEKEVNAVDWSLSHENFIASGCDDGVLCVWDY